METNVCPWCQTEIVWDDEIGPEAECPHCQNELNEYRTLNIGIDEDEEQEQQERSEPTAVKHSSEDDIDSENYWDEEINGAIAAFRALDKYETTHDLSLYDVTVAKVLDEQLEVQECPHCHEYMLLTGQQKITDSEYKPFIFSALQAPILSTPFTVNTYICSGCFHVESSLNDEDRIRFIKGLNAKKL
ncbi:DNA-directed RNA polymerase subunit RPC12/RpoP [Paenibacillus sp. DS2015]|uniref:hypothetical protein n=1 Tax=Paenibacillus sp. DS2015 TaxID=3373917 RepID=UPI003D20EE84